VSCVLIEIETTSLSDTLPSPQPESSCSSEACSRWRSDNQTRSDLPAPRCNNCAGFLRLAGAFPHSQGDGHGMSSLQRVNAALSLISTTASKILAIDFRLRNLPSPQMRMRAGMSGAGSTTIQINGNQRGPEALATLVQCALMSSTTKGSMMRAR
jgi:hypothetical protein